MSWENDSYDDEHFLVNLFNQSFQYTYESFPFGLLDVIGYWAETEILEGVLLFERGDTGREVIMLSRTALES